MRILLAFFASFKPEIGGSQVFMNLGQSLQKSGHEVIYWSPDPFPDGRPSFLWPSWLRKNLDRYLRAQRPFQAIFAPCWMITSTMRSRALKTFSFHVDQSIPYAWSSCIGFSQKNFISIFKIPWRFWIFCRHLFWSLQGWQRATRIFCQGRLDQEWMLRWTPWLKKKLRVWFPGVSDEESPWLAEIARIRKTKKAVNPDQGIRFLWIGRWVGIKGVDVLVRFICKREKEHEQDVFTLAGTGTRNVGPALLNLEKKGKVKILPNFPRQDLFSLLAQHDAGLFTSSLEGWGLILNEMIESGLPIFAARTGGVPDLREHIQSGLEPFPPPENLVLKDLPVVELKESYFRIFIWDTVRQMIEKNLSTS